MDFIQRYGNLLSANRDMEFFTKRIKESESAPVILSNIFLLCKGARQKLYIIIDEYDNFANTLLSTVGGKAYRKLTHGPGFFRSFITGVSPITLDDVTSGFNIGKNVSLDHNFNRTLGFTKEDVIEMIDYYRAKGLIHQRTATLDLLEIMTQWYGNYLFSKKDDVRLFNSDMVLYFLDNYMSEKELPEDLIDRNVRIDYGKLRHLIIVDRVQAGKERKPVPNGNFSKLKKTIGQTTVIKLVLIFCGCELQYMGEAK